MHCGWPAAARRWWTCAARSASPEATFYKWKKYGELGVSELHKLRQPEGENARLRGIVAI